jgi:hypothetical protein
MGSKKGSTDIIGYVTSGKSIDPKQYKTSETYTPTGSSDNSSSASLDFLVHYGEKKVSYSQMWCMGT